MKKISYRKLTKQQQAELKEAVLMLRFGPSKDQRKPKAVHSYVNIAKALGLQYNIVQHICRFKAVPERKKKFKASVWKLEEPQINFLLSADTLQLWATCTLQERVKLFHRTFVHKRISTTGLRRLYMKNKFKFKQVKQRKGMPQSTKDTFEVNREAILAEYANAKALG